jgi:DNA (cytosine-5)-methyltransferase 1
MGKVFFLDLFSGIGGFALGASWAGLCFDRHYFSEVDPYAIRVYSARFPDALPLGDIRAIRGADLPRGDWIIAGGFPCQDISVAGKGAGLAGARSGLWYEYARIIGELRPRYAIMENVGALAFRGLDSVLGSLAALGYDAEWQDIRASDVGAPHRRERLWIMAYPNQERRDGAGRAWNGRLESEDGGNVADTANQRDVRRYGQLGAAENEMREPGRSPQDGRREWWAVEPDVGRVASRLSPTLDGGISDGQMATEKSGATSNPPNGQVPEMRGNKESSTASSRLQQAEGSENTLSNLSCEGGFGRRDETQEVNAEMRGMREDVCPLGFAQAQDLRINLSGDPGARKRIEAVAWNNEPDIGRVATGVMNRVDRLKCLGNSIVPQIAEMIFAELAL